MEVSHMFLKALQLLLLHVSGPANTHPFAFSVDVPVAEPSSQR